MATKARQELTLIDQTDATAIVSWYRTTTGATPSAPATTSAADTPTGWSRTEPTVASSADLANVAWRSEQLVWGDGSCSWGEVTQLSAYDAAKVAYNKALAAAQTATNYITEITGDGVWVTPSDAKPDSNGNATSTTRGWKIADALELFRGTSSMIKAWMASNVAKVRVGLESAAHIVIGDGKLDVRDGSVSVAEFGSTARVGAENSAHVTVGADNVAISDDEGNALVSMDVPMAQIGDVFAPSLMLNMYHNGVQLPVAWLVSALNSAGTAISDKVNIILDYIDEIRVTDGESNGLISLSKDELDVYAANATLHGKLLLDSKYTVLESDNIDCYTAPSSVTQGNARLRFNEASGERVGEVWMLHRPSGQMCMRMECMHPMTGDYNSVAINVDEDGTPSYTLSAPAAFRNAIGASGGKWPASLVATLNQDTTGNAATATKLNTAREIYVALGSTRDSSNPVTFDGSAAKAIHVSGTLPSSRGGTGNTSLQATRNAMGLGNTTGALPVANGGTGATSAADARSNLGAQAALSVSTASSGIFTAGSGVTIVSQYYAVYGKVAQITMEFKISSAKAATANTTIATISTAARRPKHQAGASFGISTDTRAAWVDTNGQCHAQAAISANTSYYFWATYIIP